MLQWVAFGGTSPMVFAEKVEGLDLAFLIHRKHQRLVRWVQVKPDYVLNFLGEFWIVRNLEGGNEVRLQVMLGPDPLYAGVFGG